jgi:hypothetical protein
MVLYLFFTPAGVLLSKQSYAFRATTPYHGHAAFLGPLSAEQAADYLAATLPHLRPPAHAQIEAFLSTADDMRLLSG